MAKLNVTIETLSPIHLSSGRADVNIDSQITHDEFGFPYFSAKRLRGLLYESALEVSEMFALAKMDFDSATLEEIFHHESSSDVKLIVPNFYLQPHEQYQQICAEWKYLQSEYSEIFTPKDILNQYTSIRYQMKLEDGTGAEFMNNMIVLDSGVKFYGELELLHGTEKHLQLIALAFRNLKAAGVKRNRGFGQISCTFETEDGTTDEKLTTDFLKAVS